jgi:hypothetical protein
MGLSRILANRSFNKYRRVTEYNMKRTQIFLKSETFAKDKSIIVTLECSQYLMINAYDLFVLSYNYLSSKKDWDKILFARIMALYLIDFYEKIFPLIGKDLISEINNFSNIETLNAIKIIGKRISKIKTESEVNLRQIRNVTIAHKSNSGSYLMDQIYNIDHKVINDYASELTGLMTDLSTQLTKILKSYSKKRE